MKFHHSIVQTRCASPLGEIILAATDAGLAGLWFAEDQRHMPEYADWPRDDNHAVMREAAAQIDAYFGERLSVFDLPLDLAAGTPFQQAVWRQLIAIDHGATTSYGAIAHRIDKPAAMRAVGAAVGRNPISIIVPCHRVVGGAGALTGYAGGLDRKIALLRLEGVIGEQHDEAIGHGARGKGKSGTGSTSRKNVALDARGATAELPF